MSAAKLTVTQGAERGKVFVLNGEVAHIGRSAENQVVLTDPQVAEHQATIANRNGRFAIYTSGSGPLALNGKPLPTEQWIWLPADAALKLTDQTELQFQLSGDVPAADPSTDTAEFKPIPATKSLQAIRKPDRKRSGGKKPDTTQRVVAKFITDRSGETLVRLGEDGQLPELALTEGGKAPKSNVSQAAKGNPALVYAALGFSVLMSVLLLMWEPMPAATLGKSAARRTILREFIGDEGKPLKPFQKLLREAELAYSRHDDKEEREAYQSVLRLLNSEDRNPITGVTGHIEDDERLKKLLAVLLRAG